MRATRIPFGILGLTTILGILAPPSIIAAQEVPPDASPTVVGAYAAPVLGLTAFSGGTAVQAGARVGLDLGRIRIGGAGLVVLGGEEMARRSGAGTPLDLTLGYGGLTLEFIYPVEDGPRGGLGLLLGGGASRLRDPVVGVELGSDNFVVLEPSVFVDWAVASHLRVTGGAGYRHLEGLQDLPGVGSHDLRGWTAFLALAVGSLR